MVTALHVVPRLVIGRDSFALVLRLADDCVVTLLKQAKGSNLFICVLFIVLRLSEVYGNILLFFSFIRVRLAEVNVETEATVNLLTRLAEVGAVAVLVLALLVVLAGLGEVCVAAVMIQAEEAELIVLATE